jgi:hypothetical protein
MKEKVMSKAEDYQKQYSEVFKIMDASPEDQISSLSFLVEDMLETIREFEESAWRKSHAMKLELEISARKH